MKKAKRAISGDKGDKGDTGVGISKLEVIDGALYVTLTNNVKENAGLILTDEVKAWLVSQITDNAESDFNEFYNSKVTDFNTNADEKLEEYNTNATNKLNEYNTNATNKINEYNTNAEAILKILPKTETEVQENIDIDDAGESSFNKLSVFGNSRQESTTGAAKVDFGAFAGDYSDEQMEIKIDENGIISLKGTVSAYYRKKIGTITKDMFSAGNNIYYVRGNNTNNGLIFIQAIGSISFSSNNNSPSFEITDESQESDLYIVVNYLKSGTLNVNEILYPMISLESNALYEPYTDGNPSPNPDYPQEIESIKDSITFKRINANILDISEMYTEATINGVHVKYNNDGTLTLKGTATGQIQLVLRGGDNLKNGDYSFKNFGSPSNIATNIYYIGDVYGETVRSFTITEEHNYAIVYVIPINTTINATIKPMLVKGKYDNTTFPDFKQYKEENYTLPVQQNMYALVEGQEDCFVKKDDGKWYERHYSFEGELTGEELINNMSNTHFDIYNINLYDFPNAFYTKETKQYCNYFIFATSSTTIGYFYVSGNTIRLPKIFDTIEEMQSWIKSKYDEGSPVKIVYIRGETDGSILYPLDLECTPEQTTVLNKLEQFSLSKGINHIYSDDELSPKFKLMYYQDVNILLDKINKSIADVSAQLIEGGSNV